MGEKKILSMAGLFDGDGASAVAHGALLGAAGQQGLLAADVGGVGGGLRIDGVGVIDGRRGCRWRGAGIYAGGAVVVAERGLRRGVSTAVPVRVVVLRDDLSAAVADGAVVCVVAVVFALHAGGQRQAEEEARGFHGVFRA